MSRPLCAQSSPQQGKTAAGTKQTANPSPLPPDLEVKRLILKDGSYQPIKALEVKGDRVRYLSSERDEWEEVPISLVDWAATEKYARDAPARQFPKQAEKAKTPDDDEAAESRRNQRDEASPAVAPGLHLPDTGGVYLLDVFNRQAQLVEINQKAGKAEQSGRDVKRATIDSGQKQQTIQLPGPHARVQSHVPNPFFYVDIDQEANAPGKPRNSLEANDRFRLVRLDVTPKKDQRILGNINVAVFGKLDVQEKFMPATVEAFSGYWLRLTPSDPLPPGEYALVEILPDNLVNLYVWDFGVDPKAPANRGVLVADTGKAGSEEPGDAPVLNKRQHE
jgi:hypothetical protein